MRMNKVMMAAVAGAAFAGAAQGQNLLNNAGFEDPLGFDFSDTSNWNGFFGGPAGTFLQAFNDTGATPFEGSNALVLTIKGVLDPSDPNFTGDLTDGFNSFVGHVQTVGGITEGAEYDFSMWARANGAVENAAEFRVEWLDAGGGQISNTQIEYSGGLTGTYQEFAFTDVAPTGAVSANVVFALQSFTNNGIVADISVAIDAASMTLVPAPASAALLGLGGLVASRRRR